MSEGLSVADQIRASAERAEELRVDLKKMLHRLWQVEDRVRNLEGKSELSREPGTELDVARRTLEATDAFHRMANDLPLAAVAAGESLVTDHTSSAPEWLEKLGEQFPGVDPMTIVNAQSGSSANGALMLYRGFRGEQIVDELIAAGQLPVPKGTTGHSMAETTNQPGWDLLLETNGGPIPANVKISGGADSIREHFRNHPDVPVVFASSDAAQDSVGLQVGEQTVRIVDAQSGAWTFNPGELTVVDIGIKSDQVGTEVADAIAETGLQGFADEIITRLPLVAVGLVAARGAWRAASTDITKTEAAKAAGQELKNLGVNAGLGEAAAIVTGADALAAPVTITSAIVRSLSAGLRADVARSERNAAAVGRLLQSLGASFPQDLNS